MTQTRNLSLQWFHQQQQINIGTNPLDPIIICLPVTFDLTPADLLQQFHYLAMTLNASNAKYVSDAMLTISRKLPADIFLQHYLEFVGREQFQKLGKLNYPKR